MPKKKQHQAKPPQPPPTTSSTTPATEQSTHERPANNVFDSLITGPNANPLDAEEWKIRNARAKEIIMSTLVPGSEPWKIAEPLERASDIWKALEERYAPKDKLEGEESATGTNSAEEEKKEKKAELVSKPVKKVRQEKATETKLETMPTPLQPTITKTISKEQPQALPLKFDNQSSEALRRRKEAQAAAARILVEHMPNRDQRFLWALLHGGKEETMAWFNGTNVTT